MRWDNCVNGSLRSLMQSQYTATHSFMHRLGHKATQRRQDTTSWHGEIIIVPSILEPTLKFDYTAVDYAKMPDLEVLYWVSRTTAANILKFTDCPN